MWCPACRADVAAELSADNRRMLCARCQADLGTAVGALMPAAPVRSPDSERNARELLARWSTQHLLESPSTSLPIAPHSGDRRERRIEPASTINPVTVPIRDDSESSAREPVRPAAPERRIRRKRPRAASPLPASPPAATPDPETLVRQSIRRPAEPVGNWTTTVGQLCAYGGVAVLTLGTVMVLSGYFGGPANYAPTGWLVAAVGQMLLFLGVVTLVSGGMEQTVDAVAWRIDELADQVDRLERLIKDQQTRKRVRREQRPDSRARRADAA